MAVSQCPNCFVANSAQAIQCHCCGTPLKAAPGAKELTVAERAQAGLQLSDAYFEPELGPSPQEYQLCCTKCEASYERGTRFCPGCGEAVAPSTPLDPDKRLAQPIALPKQTGEDELKTQAARAKRNFIYIAILVVVMGLTLAGDIIGSNPGALHAALNMALINFFIGGLFLGFALWARSDPLPATLAGLVLYVSLSLIFMEIDLHAGHPERLSLLLCIRVAIVCILVQTITAGFRHRRLRTWARFSH